MKGCRQVDWDSDDLSVTFDGGVVAGVEIDRPPHNFMTSDLIQDILDVCLWLADNTRCRAVVLSGAGRHFCAGTDFSQNDRGARTRQGETLYEVGLRLAEQPLPIVAAVQGSAIGGGLGLAMMADFRIATPEARFSANFARLGIHQGFGLSETLPRVVGNQAALRMLYTGARLDGSQALEVGLCDGLVPADQLHDASWALAQDIAGSAPLALRAIRRTMRGPLVQALRAVLPIEQREQSQLLQTADFQEGIAAVSERRPPDFRGF
jgi:2-(1,2-epoxy-1,2-dihydrophenyl)acetyl-CoA isomerase